MQVKVTHSIGDLAADLRTITAEAKPTMAKTVRAEVELGNQLARGFARKASGPHGKNYFKRITAEMTGLLSGEFGPTGVVEGNAVGAGWRHGAGNTDLLQAADIIATRFGQAVLNDVDGLFWPGA